MWHDLAFGSIKHAEMLDELDRSIRLAIKGYLMPDTQNRKRVGGNIHSVSGTTHKAPGLGCFKACFQAAAVRGFVLRLSPMAHASQVINPGLRSGSLFRFVQNHIMCLIFTRILTGD